MGQAKIKIADIVDLASAATASVLIKRDANANAFSNNFISSYLATATAAGTTTLTISSARVQIFTGSTTQTVVLPVVSTLALGHIFEIVNVSSGVVTVQSSGANSIQAMAAGSRLIVTSNATTGTGASVWTVTYIPALTNVENTALSTWAGTSNITILGTISTGVWQGTLISPTYGGTGVNNSSRTLTISTNSGTISFTSATTLTVAATASVSGTNTGDQTTVTGNAGTATALQNPRTIGGVTFAGTGNITVATATGGFTVSGGSLTLSTQNIVTDTSTGTKFGTATNQKLGFFNSAPIVQPTGDVITALQNLGLIASATIVATTITARTLWGQTYDGSGNVTGTLTSVGDITGGASSMTITAGTGASRTLVFKTTTSGSTATTTLTLNADQTATFASGATLAGATTIGIGNAFTAGTLEVGHASDSTISRVSAGVLAIEGANILVSGGALGTPASGTLSSCTGLPVSGITASTSTALGVGSIELGHASDTTLSRSSAGVLAVEGVVVPTTSSTNTLTNKRVTKRTGTTTSSATPTINTDNVDFYSLTAQAADITSFTTNLSGTPTENQTLWIAVTGTGARALSFGASFEASTIALPTTTVSTNRLDMGFVWNTVTSKWRIVAAA